MRSNEKQARSADRPRSGAENSAPGEGRSRAPGKPAERARAEGGSDCNFEDASKIRRTVAEILHAEPHPKADKLIKIQLRLGDREKQICAGIRAYYQPEELIGRRIVVVDNLEPRKLRGELSNGMLLAAHRPDDTLALVPLDKPDFPSGGPVS